MTKRNYRHASALLFLAALTGPASLLAQFSSPIRDVENPAHFAVRLTGQITIGPGFAFGNAFVTPNIPAGKRLVLEFASGNCTASSSPGIDVAFVTVATTEAQPNGALSHPQPLAFTRAAGFGGVVTYYTSQPFRVYHDGGPFNIFYSTGLTNLVPANGVVNCFIELSGYTVTLP